MGERIKTDDAAAQIKTELTLGAGIMFPVVFIPTGALLLKQMPPETNFVCIHAHARKVDCDGNPIVRSDANTHFTQVTCIFMNDTVHEQYERCYMKSSVVNDWMSKSKSNRERTLVCSSIQEYSP